ncbi:MAG: elongation factor G [Gemmatimonadota bacterium]|nr:elongation factor G [Gemmatimonadota bacterium]MDE2870590.1 elongation factor G [Gemmatimonadota bacterium]
MARSFRTENIRNVVVLGHGGSGKTTLIDAVCFAAGTSRRKGNVNAGTALTMTTPEETGHGMSMQLTVAHAIDAGTKINFLDTPGYMDFAGEAAAAVRVADAAVVTVGAASGVEVGTEMVWQLCEERALPRMIFVSMMDKMHANFGKVLAELRDGLAPGAIPVQIPIGAAAGFRGVVDLFTGRAHVYKGGAMAGEYGEADVPDEVADDVETWQTELMETLATTDEELLDRYLEGEAISVGEQFAALAGAVAEGEVVPVFCGAAEQSFGVREFAELLVALAPHPGRGGGVEAIGDDGSAVDLRAADDESVSALVFKTSAEPHVGELSLFRVFSGMVANGTELRNAGREAGERINHLAIPQGKERVEVEALHAGDIGVVAKLKSTRTNDTLSAPANPVTLEGVTFPQPDISIAVRGVARADEDKLGEALAKLNDEDPTFVAGFNPEIRQTIARGLGELHLDVQFERMKRKYGVTVETEPPRIAYRETITAEAEGQGRFKKQTGGRGQFGDCWVRLRPRDRGEGYEFVSSIKGGVIPTKYVPSVDRGIQEAATKGVVAGYPVVDFEAECYDGSYHSVDSSDIAFKVAGSYAFRNVAEKAKPALLEPIIEVTVTVPDEYVGDVMGDLNGRSARVLGMEPLGGKTAIMAQVAEAELYKYASVLRSITQGRGFHRRKMLGYDLVPPMRVEKIVAEAAEREG